MNKIYCIVLAAFMAACATADKSAQHTSVVPLPYLPIGSNDSVKGISAPFTGILNNQLITIGGCNFPTTPAAEGGKKIYYNDIYTLDITSPKEWKHLGYYPQKVAYGATVAYNNKLICVGGNDDKQAFTSVTTIETIDGNLVIDTLPSMPVTMDNHSATIHKDVLYAGGGNIDGKPQTRIFSFNLKTKGPWIEITSFPGCARIQPQLIGINDKIVLLGGFFSSVQTGAVLSTQVLAYSIKQESWDTLTTLPISTMDNKHLAMIGGFSVVQSQTNFIIGGGVNRSRFEQALNMDLSLNNAKMANNQVVVDSIVKEKKLYMLHQPTWYEFNTQLFTFDMKTGQWSELANAPQLARAGAGIALHNNNELYIVGGELKPGIRTDEVNLLKW